MKKIVLISFIALIIDQVIKIAINFFIPLNSSVVVIKNFFNLTYVRNYGAAFSILEGNRIVFITFGILSLIAIYYGFIKNNELKLIEKINYGILIGGILGNLVDRIFLGYVIDYLDFNILGYNFAIFNLADSFIVIAAIVLIIFLVGEDYGKNKNK